MSSYTKLLSESYDYDKECILESINIRDIKNILKDISNTYEKNKDIFYKLEMDACKKLYDVTEGGDNKDKNAVIKCIDIINNVIDSEVSIIIKKYNNEEFKTDKYDFNRIIRALIIFFCGAKYSSYCMVLTVILSKEFDLWEKIKYIIRNKQPYGFEDTVAFKLQCVIFGPIREETQKRLAARFNCSIEYGIIFNLAETTEYTIKGMISGYSAKYIIKARLKHVVTLHTVNQLIHYVTSNRVLEKLGIKEDAGEVISIIGFIGAILIHMDNNYYPFKGGTNSLMGRIFGFEVE